MPIKMSVRVLTIKDNIAIETEGLNRNILIRAKSYLVHLLRSERIRKILLGSFQEIYQSIVASGMRKPGDVMDAPGAYTTGETAQRFRITIRENGEIHIYTDIKEWRVGHGSYMTHRNTAIQYIYPVRARVLRFTLPSGAIAFAKRVKTYRSLGRFTYIHSLYAGLLKDIISNEIKTYIKEFIFE